AAIILNRKDEVIAFLGETNPDRRCLGVHDRVLKSLCATEVHSALNVSSVSAHALGRDANVNGTSARPRAERAGQTLGCQERRAHNPPHTTAHTTKPLPPVP